MGRKYLKAFLRRSLFFHQESAGARHNNCNRAAWTVSTACFSSLIAPAPPSSALDYDGQPQFAFEVLHTSKRSNARVGRISTPHGIIDTPGFVPVATNAALKALDVSVADSLGTQLLFCNSYHLMLHPGVDVVKQAGGIHAFMGRQRDKPIITDSGGFQIFSLAHGTVHEELRSLKRNTSRGPATRRDNLVVRVDDTGVKFRSYRDGSIHHFSPESSVAAQKALGADIILPLDELPPYHVSLEALTASVARSHLWEARSLAAHAAQPSGQAMYGIIHGGSSDELRRASAAYISSLPFDGLAIGGSLGADSQELQRIVQVVMTSLLQCVTKPRTVHVLGVADPGNVANLASLGCDTFDSCYATRVGRHGAMLTEPTLNGNGLLRVSAAANKSAHRPPIEDCECPICMSHTLSYLHHLVKVREPIAATLLSVHNIHFMCRWMERLRTMIHNDLL